MISEEQISQILTLHSEGDTLNTLWDKCTDFTDKITLASALNLCVKNKKLFRNIGQYSKIKTKIVENIAPVKVKKVKVKTIKYGSLSRSTHVGAVAFALYAYKDHLDTDKLSELLGEPPRRIYPALRRLCALGYVYKRVTKTGDTHKWSATYDYPFSSAFNSDATLIKHLQDAFSLEGITNA